MAIKFKQNAEDIAAWVAEKASITNASPSEHQPAAKQTEVIPPKRKQSESEPLPTGINTDQLVEHQMYLVSAYIEPIPADATFSYPKQTCKRRFSELQRGKIPYEARLDLHGSTLVECAEKLHYFIQNVRSQGLKCVLIIHGKGNPSTTANPHKLTLKSCVHHWFRLDPRILAFCTCLPKLGGHGATLVLL